MINPSPEQGKEGLWKREDKSSLNHLRPEGWWDLGLRGVLGPSWVVLEHLWAVGKPDRGVTRWVGRCGVARWGGAGGAVTLCLHYIFLSILFVDVTQTYCRCSMGGYAQKPPPVACVAAPLWTHEADAAYTGPLIFPRRRLATAGGN